MIKNFNYEHCLFYLYFNTLYVIFSQKKLSYGWWNKFFVNFTEMGNLVIDRE